MTAADQLALDAAVFSAEAAASVAAPGDPWLARRGLGFGCSDLAALFVALGLRAADGLPKYEQEKVRLLFARKASGRQTKAGAAAKGGQRRERDVLAAWVAARCPGSDVRPSTVRHADEMPREWLPLVDRYEPRLTCTPDAWGRDDFGGLVAIEIRDYLGPALPAAMESRAPGAGRDRRDGRGRRDRRVRPGLGQPAHG